MPLKAIDRRSRSAGSPALPTAATMRPQLASSPAMAVLTRGSRRWTWRCAWPSPNSPRPRTVISTKCRAPSPSLHHLVGEIEQQPRPEPCGSRRGGGRRPRDNGAPRLPPRRSRTASACPMVEVSLSTVMALKDVLRSSTAGPAAPRRRSRASVNDEGQHRRHVRRDHARALGDAGDGTVTPSISALRAAHPWGRCRWS